MPVLFLAIFYLFKMGIIVDRIVSLDATKARLAEQTSVEMLQARRAERNYFLLHDAAYLQTNRDSLARVRQSLREIDRLDSGNQNAVQEALGGVDAYERQFAAAVVLLEKPSATPVQRIQGTVKTHEKDLHRLLQRAAHTSRAQMIEELHRWVDSFDADIAQTVEAGDPTLRNITLDLQTSSQKVLRIAADLEARNWTRVQQSHEETQRLTHRAEWVLSVVSGLTLILSIWISFTLPRRVVKPLVDLREAVDHAAAGNYEIDFELAGEGEVVDLARSVRELIAHVQQNAVKQARP
ncbi:MAG: hypothetical protein LAP21_00645 [Acidobacteriia bacterium]|nr:hypothetical protein [Terriglobia bacterium]